MMRRQTRSPARRTAMSLLVSSVRYLGSIIAVIVSLTTFVNERRGRTRSKYAAALESNSPSALWAET